MSCKSMLYAASTTSQTVTAGASIGFGSAIRKFGSSAYMSGGNVEIKGQGYYDIETNFTIVPSTSGTVTIAIYKDGMAIPGAVASQTVVADNTYALTVPTVTRQVCCCESTITAVITGTGASVTNAAIIVEKE